MSTSGAIARSILLFFLCATLAVAANAQDGRVILQVGSGFGQADGLLAIPFVGENGVIPGGPTIGDDTSTIWNLALGYRIVSGLYLELGYTSLGEYEASPDVRGLRTSADLDEWQLGVRYERPLNDRLAAIWRFGATRVSLDSDRLTITSELFGDSFSTEPIPDESGYSWGAGLLWKLKGNLSFGVTYDRHELDSTDLGSLTLSLSTRFWR